MGLINPKVQDEESIILAEEIGLIRTVVSVPPVQNGLKQCRIFKSICNRLDFFVGQI